MSIYFVRYQEWFQKWYNNARSIADIAKVALIDGYGNNAYVTSKVDPYLNLHIVHEQATLEHYDNFAGACGFKKHGHLTYHWETIEIKCETVFNYNTGGLEV